MKDVRYRKQKHFYVSLHSTRDTVLFYEITSILSQRLFVTPHRPTKPNPPPPLATAAAQRFRNPAGLFLVYVRLYVFDLQAFIHNIF